MFQPLLLRKVCHHLQATRGILAGECRMHLTRTPFPVMLNTRNEDF